MSIKFTFSLLLGAAIGGAIAHYLHTMEGRALVNRVKEDTNDLVGHGPDRESALGNKYEPEMETVVVVGLEA